MSPQITAHSRRSGNVVPLCLGSALRLLGILPSPSTLTRKRGPDSGGTLRPPVRIACVPCSAFFTGRPLSCAPYLSKALACLQRAGPMPRYPRRLLSSCCSLLYRGRLCRARHPWMWARSSRACGLCRAPHRVACHAELVLLATPGCSGRCACVLRCAGLLKSIAARCSVLR